MLGLETPVTRFHFFSKEIINMTQKDTMNIKPTLIKYDEQSIKKNIKKKIIKNTRLHPKRTL